MSQVITKEKIKRFCILYIGSNKLGEVSYTELYDHLTKEKNVSLPLAVPFSHSNDLLIIMKEITFFDLTDYHNPRTPLVGVNINDYRESLRNQKVPVQDIVHDTYENELRLEKSEKDSSESLIISRRSYIIALAAIVVTAIQLLVDTYDIHIGKDFRYENKSLMYDSIQVEQNKQMIELLKEQNTRLKSIQDSIKSIKPDTIVIYPTIKK